MLLGGITCWWPEKRRQRIARSMPSEAIPATVGVGVETGGEGTIVVARLGQIEEIDADPVEERSSEEGAIT